MSVDKVQLIQLFKKYEAYKEDHDTGFLLASGQRSPFYVDCRVMMGHGNARMVIAEMAGLALRGLTFGPHSIGGLATGAIAFATAISDCMQQYRTFYIRKEVKDHGAGLKIEGAYQPGDNVVIVDDVLTSGGSIKMAADQVGATTALVIVDREQGGKERLHDLGIEVHALVTLSELRGQ